MLLLMVALTVGARSRPHLPPSPVSLTVSSLEVSLAYYSYHRLSFLLEAFNPGCQFSQTHLGCILSYNQIVSCLKKKKTQSENFWVCYCTIYFFKYELCQVSPCHQGSLCPGFHAPCHSPTDWQVAWFFCLFFCFFFSAACVFPFC